MSEIKIKNSRVNLELIDVSKPGTSIDLDKKSLRYQYGVFVDASGQANLTTFYGISKTVINKLGTLMILKKIDKVNPADIVLNVGEYISVLRFLSAFVKYKPVRVCEALVKSTNDKDLIEGYYKSFGQSMKTDYINLIEKKILGVGSGNYKPNNITYSYDYKENYGRYSVMSLIKDILDNGLKVSCFPEVLKYNRVSSTKVDVTGNTVKYTEDFNKVTGILTNKSRANISLKYISTVEVTEPDGTVHPDLNVFHSFCLIKDGTLNTRFLGVSGCGKKLINKFNKMGIIFNTIRDGELVLDLSKLPVTSPKDVGMISRTNLESLVYKMTCINFQLGYLEFLENSSAKKSATVPAAKKTSSVIDLTNMTYNPKEETKNSGKKYSYWDVNISYEKGFPTTKEKRTIVFNNKATLPKGKLEYNLIKDIDDQIAAGATISSLKASLEKNKEFYSKGFNEFVFKFIMSKTCSFYNCYNDAIKKNYKSTGKYGDVKFLLEMKKHNITV